MRLSFFPNEAMCLLMTSKHGDDSEHSLLLDYFFVTNIKAAKAVPD